MQYLGKPVHRGNVVTVHVGSELVGVQGYVTRVDEESCIVEAFVDNRTARYRCTVSNGGNMLIGVSVKNAGDYHDHA
ncbi:hypothetical protein [Alicyclobacillus mengziensis]|uniref:Uncharacterized protein n=1 Tax=Alicyclobacillus mengziensis TaxID=2931921 RepID=A0A9X7VX10_9BACL|nr:hypothetical protein [Alicyclobacillus mengziensis]QSO46603.1 hypothetical protein JZ786_19440 [Alicyclobacillus mengziensis]